MAIIYGKNTAVDYAAGNIASFGKSYSRMGAAPLDKYEVWYNYAELVKYASYRGDDKDGNPVYDGNTEVTNTSAVTSYVGQKVAYVNETEGKIYHYSIELDGSLKEIGADPLNVEALAKGDGGKIPKAFWIIDSEAVGEEGSEDYQPEVGHIEIHWVAPEAFEDTNTVTTVAAADKSVNITADKNDTINKDYKVKVNISEENGNSLELKTDGLFVGIPEAILPEYAVRKEEKTGYHGIYHLTKDNVDVEKAIEVPDYTVSFSTKDGAENDEHAAIKHYSFYQGKDAEGNPIEIAHIDIPTDLVVKSGEVVVATDKDKANDSNVVVGETYIKLVIANQTMPLYIAAKNLVDVYTGAITNSAEVVVSGDNKISANVKVSTKSDNILSILSTGGQAGLYVPPVVHPTSADEVVTNQYVTAVDQKDGKITVSRKQISYNELADLPAITGEKAIIVEDKTDNGQQDKVVKLLIDEANKGNVILTQSETGLKANVEIPAIDISGSMSGELSGEEITAPVITSLKAVKHSIIPTVIDVVTKDAWNKIVGENGVRVLNQEEINKLSLLNLENGQVTISGTVNASQVRELGSAVVDIVTGDGKYMNTPAQGVEGEEGYVAATFVDKLHIQKGAQVNKIEEIALPDAVLDINDKQINIPSFVEGKYGVIKGASLVEGKATANKVYANDGVGEVKAISTDILVQGEYELILNGGNASLSV